MSKPRIGILFGGRSREREIAFAGARTVYDNLDRSRFEPVPIFIDSLGGLVRLDWPYIYKGTIRDFFPPANAYPADAEGFQLYVEHLDIEPHSDAHFALLRQIGEPLRLEDLPRIIDFAFLSLHGNFGEDGRIQGLLEWLGIPYSGCGIFPSSVGIDKLRQHTLQKGADFNAPKYLEVNLKGLDVAQLQAEVQQQVGYPCVVKHPTQGSSIGVKIVDSTDDLAAAIEAVQFRAETDPAWFNSLDEDAKRQHISSLTDIRSGIGLPARVQADDNDKQIIRSPRALKQFIEASSTLVQIQAIDAPHRLLIEQFIDGTEFSVIVIESPDGQPLALPPTEIRKVSAVYDYRAKYLPGIANKVTPIELPDVDVRRICQRAEQLYTTLGMEVYARLDGIINRNGEVYLNDPNTTSGMLPSSFFFHQAAEVGLSPKDLLTLLIRQSVRRRAEVMPGADKVVQLRKKLAAASDLVRSSQSDAFNVAVIFGGYSSERHISVESGRNIFEKLNSAEGQTPIPHFLLHNNYLSDSVKDRLSIPDDPPYSIWRLPINLLLKDNADDIAKSIAAQAEAASTHALVQQITGQVAEFAGDLQANASQPEYVSLQQLVDNYDFAFLALHGRPGEDGDLQARLERLGLPFNGSASSSAQLSMDKYATNEKLIEAGLLAPKHRLVQREDWEASSSSVLDELEAEFGYPLIGKPVDDGCSSAVRKIDSRDELQAFIEAIFREDDEVAEHLQKALQISPKEEFPIKTVLLFEELIRPNDADRFLEITVGFQTHTANGKREYRVLAPSEALVGAGILSLEEKFLAGQGQNITPARFSSDPQRQAYIDRKVREAIEQAAKAVDASGYGRIDAFVRVFDTRDPEVIFIEVNSLPGMTPATCIFHQAALEDMTPAQFIQAILREGLGRFA